MLLRFDQNVCSMYAKWVLLLGEQAVGLIGRKVCAAQKSVELSLEQDDHVSVVVAMVLIYTKLSTDGISTHVVAAAAAVVVAVVVLQFHVSPSPDLFRVKEQLGQYHFGIAVEQVLDRHPIQLTAVAQSRLLHLGTPRRSSDPE